MSVLDEAGIRAELHRAVDVLDPLPPPFTAVLARGRRRRRTRWVVGGVGLAAAVAAAIVAVVVLAPGGAGTQTVTPAAQPPPLRAYARQHGGVPVTRSPSSLGWVVGPVTTGAGRFGAFVTKRDLVVVELVRGHWQEQASLPVTAGPPSVRLGIQRGPTLPSRIPTFVSRGEGGDVSYFGAVAVELGGRWQFAHFGRCGKAGCGNGVDQVSYLRYNGGRLVSDQNDCIPYCAAGKEYAVTWAWAPSRQRFEATSVTAVPR